MRRVATGRRLAAGLVALLLAAPLAAHPRETLHYRWTLGGFFGTLARMFMPGHGHGALETKRTLEGLLEVQLDITSPSAEGEFWRYGAAIDPDDGRTLRAWSSYKFRGRTESKESELEEEAVIDVASGITLLRRERPEEPRDLHIWNDGKVYPVTIFPRERVLRRVGERQVVARHYAVRARHVPGEREWKGQLDIYLAEDDAATPVEIAVERRKARVRLQLEDQ